MVQVERVHVETFRNGSKTYFNSTRFFPVAVRDEVFALYGFVRTADNYVDAVPQDGAGFESFVARYRRALNGERTGDAIIDSFVELAKRRSFHPEWTEAFLKSMQNDLYRSRYWTLDEMLEYVYGSAEVIGLYMAAILELVPEAAHAARMLGRAMQVIKFIRDIDEDEGFGRTYLPLSETTLPNLRAESAAAQPDEFVRFVGAQLERYRGWQAEAELGYRFLPKRYRVPIKTAADMYNWTAGQIERDPFVVYRTKVKPAKARIVARGIRNVLVG